ncbi:MAG: hypothetical protein GC129_06815 [Proteobacteria bacterium]|nr:hypothetical protein [Pseudomonadota bacterium]
MLKALTALMLLALAGPLWAEELGPDGFPADWKDSDFKPLAAKVPSMTEVYKAPKTFEVQDLPHVRLEPSGTVPVALPAAGKVQKSAGVSTTYYQPLAAAFEGGVAPAGLAVSGSMAMKNNDLSMLAGVGTLRPDDGGMKADVWINSSLAGGVGRQKAAESGGSAAKLVQLMDKLAAEAGNGGKVGAPSVREGWRRLLLSDATAPSGTTVASRHWLVLRARALEGLGLHEAALSLWREVGPQARMAGEGLARGWVRASLLAGENGPPCQLAKQLAAAGAKGQDWTLEVATCAAVDAGSGGNSNALGLSLQLVPASTAKKAPAAVAALEAVRDGRTLGDTAPAAGEEGLLGAVAAAFPAIVGDSDMAGLPDVALRRLRDSKALPDDLRTRAARALADKTGWVSDGVGLVALVSGGVISASTPDAAVVAWGERNQEPGGREPGKYGAQEAGLVVDASLRLGQVAVASAWWPRLVNMQEMSLEQRRELVERELVFDALAKGELDTRVLEKWLVMQDLGTAEGAAHAERLMAGLEGLGMGVPEDLWANYRARAVKLDGGDASWRRLLEHAAQGKDAPAVLALVSEGLAGKPADAAPPEVVGQGVAALSAAGLRDLAGRLLAEAVRPRLAEVPTAPVAAQPILPAVAEEVSPSTQVKGLLRPALKAEISASVPEPEGLLPPPRVVAPTPPVPPRAPGMKGGL